MNHFEKAHPMPKPVSFLICLTMAVLSISKVRSHEPSQGITVEVLAKSENSWDGKSLPDFSQKQTEVTVLRITISPKATLPVHKHPVINAGYMVSGHLTVHSESGKVLKLKPGDAIIELVDQFHYGINETDKPVVIVVVYTGTTGTPLSIKEPSKPAQDQKSKP